MSNCANCGAPLPSNGKCEYCGTEHNRISNIHDAYYKINFDGTEHICYIGSVKTDIIYSGGGRNIDGEMEKGHTSQKLRFELVEL